MGVDMAWRGAAAPGSPGWLAAPGGPAAGLVFILLAEPLFNEGSSFGCSLVYMV